MTFPLRWDGDHSLEAPEFPGMENGVVFLSVDDSVTTCQVLLTTELPTPDEDVWFYDNLQLCDGGGRGSAGALRDLLALRGSSGL